MITINFGDNFIEELIICLGSFDGIHRGHQALIKKANELKKPNQKIALFTFDDGFSRLMKGDKSIFTLKEKLQIFERFEIDVVIKAKFDDDFLNLSAEDFLLKLNSLYNINMVVCGSDYTFGHGKTGNHKLLESFFKGQNKNSLCLDVVYDGLNKISSSLIKIHLQAGRIAEANRLLGYDYFSEGIVIHGEHQGTKLGYPTLNTRVFKEKKKLKLGVYKTVTEIEGIFYKSITNYGSAPTFNRNNFIIETHVLDYDADTYGKTVKVFFKEFVRGIKRFSSKQELVEQIREDIKAYD